MDLGHVVGMLLEPQPRFGRATVETSSSGETTTWQVAFTRAPDQWVLQADNSAESFVCDGTTRAMLRQGRVIEASPAGRPNQRPMWPLFPQHAFLWGRSCDDWRLCERPEHDDNLLTVQLAHMQDDNVRGHVRLDLDERLVTEIDLVRQQIRLRALETTAPDPSVFTIES